MGKKVITDQQMALRIYFPNLNGLRFIVALLIIIRHFQQNKNFFACPIFGKCLSYPPSENCMLSMSRPKGVGQV
jgi:hypothetical protein